MKTMLVKVILLVAFAATTVHSSTGDFSEENGVNEPKEWRKVLGREPSSALGDRFKRQTETTTTPKPKKHRPSNIFALISELITETRQDTSRAFNEIGTLFNSQFADSRNTTQNKEPKTEEASTTTTSTTSSSDSDSDDENEITTTTEPYRITRDEFLGILRSNFQGISQLFRKEFRVAIQDSNQNVREFGRDLGTALRPYFN